MGGMSMLPGGGTPNFANLLGQAGQAAQPQQAQQPQAAQAAVNPLDLIPQLVPQPMNSVQQAPWAANPYAGFQNQPLPSEGQRLGGLTPEDWVYKQMMAGMGAQVPGMQTNQLVPGSNAPAQYTPNPYAATLGSIVPQIPTGGETPGTPPVTPEAWLAYDLNKNNKLGKKEKKAFKAADLTGFKDWKSTLAGVPGSVPDSGFSQDNPFYR